jgi:ParB-like chromosome segregation protein Spo0J
MNKLRINGKDYTCPFMDLLPRLAETERAELASDIEENGITVPVVVTAEDEVIDGHHRAEIAAELGIPVPLTEKRYDGLAKKRHAAHS